MVLLKSCLFGLFPNYAKLEDVETVSRVPEFYSDCGTLGFNMTPATLRDVPNSLHLPCMPSPNSTQFAINQRFTIRNGECKYHSCKKNELSCSSADVDVTCSKDGKVYTNKCHAANDCVLEYAPCQTRENTSLRDGFAN